MTVDGHLKYKEREFQRTTLPFEYFTHLNTDDSTNETYTNLARYSAQNTTHRIKRTSKNRSHGWLYIFQKSNIELTAEMALDAKLR